jgi:hypothetical protein
MGQRLGHGLLERFALEASGDQVAIRSDQEWRVGAPYRVAEFERVRSAVAEYGVRRGAVAGY